MLKQLTVEEEKVFRDWMNNRFTDVEEIGDFVLASYARYCQRGGFIFQQPSGYGWEYVSDMGEQTDDFDLIRFVRLHNARGVLYEYDLAKRRRVFIE